MVIRVYLRLPHRIDEELTIRNLHPEIEIIKLMRQKCARHCFLDFADAEKSNRVMKELKKIRLNGKRLKVALVITKDKSLKRPKIPKKSKRIFIDTQAQPNEQIKVTVPRANMVCAKNLPPKITRRDIKNVFTNCLSVRILKSKSEGRQVKALISFSSELEAIKFCKHPPTLKGQQIEVSSANVKTNTVKSDKQEKIIMKKPKKTARYFDTPLPVASNDAQSNESEEDSDESDMELEEDEGKEAEQDISEGDAHEDDDEDSNVEDNDDDDDDNSD